MNLNYSYYYFKAALTPRFCKEVIDFAKSKKEVLGRTGNIQDENLSKKQIKNIQKDRDSNVSLQYTEKTNIMIGIVIVGMNHIKKDHRKVKLENYL